MVNVVQGQRYRFRLINMAMEANFNVSVDGHSFTVIEADGINTEPLAVDSLQIFAGNNLLCCACYTCELLVSVQVKDTL